MHSPCILLLALLCLLMVFAGNVWAAISTVAPSGTSVTGTWTTTPLHSKVNEDIDTPNVVFIQSPTNAATPTNDVTFTITCPSDLVTITGANLRVRAKASNTSGRLPQIVVSWSANAGNNVSSGNLTTTWTNYNTNVATGLSISKATCDSSTIKIAPSTTGSGAGTASQVDSVNLDVTYTAVAPNPMTHIDSRQTGPWSAMSTWTIRIASNVATTGSTNTLLNITGNTNSFLDAKILAGDAVVCLATCTGSALVTAVNSATQLALGSGITGLAAGATVDLRRVPTNGDKVRLRGHDVTIDQDVATTLGLKGLHMGAAYGETSRLTFDGTTAAASYTVKFGSTSNAAGSEVGTVSAWTYTPAGTPATTPGVTVSGLKPWTQSETWRFICTTAGTGTSSRWTLTGSVSGLIATNLAAGTAQDVDGTLQFQQFTATVNTPGAAGYQVNDTLTAFSTAPGYVGIHGNNRTDLNLVGTATRTLTFTAAVEDHTKNWYWRINESDPVTVKFVNVRYAGAAAFLNSEYGGLGIYSTTPNVVNFEDMTFTGLGQLYSLNNLNQPHFTRLTFTDSQVTGWVDQPIVFIQFFGAVGAGTYTDITFNDNIGGRYGYFMQLSGGTGTAAVLDNIQTNLSYGAVPYASSGLHIGGGTSASNRWQLKNSTIRSVPSGAAPCNKPGGDANYYLLDARGWFDVHNNQLLGGTIVELEQGANGVFYNNLISEGGGACPYVLFVKYTDARLDVYNNIIVAPTGGATAAVLLGGAEGLTDLRFYNNTMLVGAGVALQIGDAVGTQVVQLYNNIVVNTGTGTIGINDVTGTETTYTSVPNYNIVHNFTTPWFSSGIATGWGSHPASNESTANPLLVSTTVGSADLAKLSTGSPAINAGVDTTDTNAVSTDIYGASRKQGATIDIGATEAAPAAASSASRRPIMY